MYEKHMQRVRQDEARTHRQRKKNTRMSRLLLLLMMLCFSLCCLVGVMATIETPAEKNAAANAAAEKEKTKDDPFVSPEVMEDNKWTLVLVNKQKLIPADFTVDLKKFGNTRVDCRIVQPLADLINAGMGGGVTLVARSGYRSVAEQKVIYENKVAAYTAQGYSRETSEINANQYIQPPGASEHHTGLAVDLAINDSAPLDDSFAQTEAYAWLCENAANYGFVERYPKDKSELTGILWEPWHFRYVGIENAKAMKALGICLEEYA